MGLDMYLNGNKFYWHSENKEEQLMEDGFVIRDKTLRLGYWRKHPNLHGFIVKEFADGKDKCQEITLSGDDVSKIIQAVKDKSLPETDGFFFGKSDGSEDEETIEIFERALAWLHQAEPGISKDIVYEASW